MVYLFDSQSWESWDRTQWEDKVRDIEYLRHYPFNELERLVVKGVINYATTSKSIL